MTGPGDRPAVGAAWGLGAIAVFSAQDAIAKWLAADYPVIEIVFFRSFFALLPCLLIVRRDGGLRALRTRRPLLHLARLAALFVSIVTFFLAIRRLPLADAVAITFSAPLFMTLFAVLLLGERVGLRRWLAIAVGFAGVLVVVQPQGRAVDVAAWLAIAASLTFSLGTIATRSLAKSDSTAAIVVFFTLGTIVVAGAMLPWFWVAPPPGDLALFAVMGLIGGLGAFAIVQAYRHAPVSLVAPLEYTALLWASLFGVLVWGDVPTAHMLAGAAIIVAANLYILRRERRRALPEPAGGHN